MKKKFLLIILFCLAVCAAICGCNCKGCSNEEPPPDDTGEHVHEYASSVTEPTCTEGGYTLFTCACGVSYTSEETSALGHDYEETVIPFTCTTDGYTKKVCSRCKDEQTAADSTVAAHHTYVRQDSPSSCILKGSYKLVCEVCAAEAKGDVLPYAEHSFENGVCKVCHGTEGLEYELLKSGEGYAVKGIGSATATDIVPLTVYNGKPVVAVADKAFYNNTAIVSILLPECIKTMGNSVFEGATNLQSVVLKGVTEIGKNAFLGATELKAVDFCEGITVLPESSFENCTSLISSALPESLKKIGDKAFFGSAVTEVDLGGNIEEIGAQAFAYTPLKSVDIPKKVTEISNNAFKECTALDSVTFGGEIDGVNITSLGSGAFFGCKNLYGISMPNIESFGAGAFEGCETLNYAVLGTKYTALPERAFFGCKALGGFSLSSAATQIGASAFEGCESVYLALYDCITRIGERAFFGCASILQLNVPENLESLGKSAFEGCIGLSDVSINQKLGVIPEGAFKNCYNLVRVGVPASVTEIKSYAFEGCIKLFEVFNASELNIVRGENAHGEIARYAVNVSSDGVSILKTEGNFITYPEGNILLGYTGNAKSLTLPEDIEGNEYAVYDYAFYGKKFEEVTIPQKVSSIGERAFYACKNLKSVTFGAANCSDLVEGADAFVFVAENLDVVIKNTVRKIPANLFSKAGALRKVSFEETSVCTEIGANSFAESGLSELYLPKSLTVCPASAFKNCRIQNLTYNCVNLSGTAFANAETNLLKIGPDAERINSGVFGNSFIHTFELGESSLSYISADAFEGCVIEKVCVYDLETWFNIDFENAGSNPCIASDGIFFDGVSVSEITVPDGLPIKPYVFYKNTNINRITVGDAPQISPMAFYDCYALTEISLPYLPCRIDELFGSGSVLRVTVRSGEIPVNAFKNTEVCEGEVVLGAAVTAIGESAFEGFTGLCELTLPNISKIEANSFKGCGLTEIAIPDSVTEIGVGAFEDCINLDRVGFDSGSRLTKISSRAFSGCRCLTQFTIPKDVTEIGASSFDGCYKLFEVYNLTGIDNSHSVIRSATQYALAVYNSLSAERAFKNLGGYLFMESGTDVYLVGYEGSDRNLVLPMEYMGRSYKIYSYAFAFTASINSVELSDGVTEMGVAAFSGCARLTDFCISKAVTRICADVLKDCTRLISLKYKGSEDEWNAVTKDTPAYFSGITFEG